MSILGYAVGLGNVWRFPIYAIKHEGSFLIPYLILAILVGLPLFFIELALGQYSAFGPTRLFGKMAPIFKGLGFAMVAVSSVVSIAYCVVISWSLLYMGSSFQAELPWNSTMNFYNSSILGIPNLNNSFELNWKLVICLLVAWIIVSLCIIKGIHGSGKVAYFTVIFPYLALFVLLAFGLNISEAKENITTFLFKPNITKLSDPEVRILR